MNTQLESLLHEKLKLSLGNSLRKGYQELLQQIGEEDLYALGIYTSGEYNYLVLTANTIEGLETKTIEYGEIPDFQSLTRKEISLRLKWSPCDWKYHDLIYLDDSFEVDVILIELNAFAEENELYDELYQGMNQVFVEVLTDFRKKRSSTLASVNLSIWKGDQSQEERMHFVKLLNNEKLIQQYLSDIGAFE